MHSVWQMKRLALVRLLECANKKIIHVELWSSLAENGPFSEGFQYENRTFRLLGLHDSDWSVSLMISLSECCFGALELSGSDWSVF